MSSCKITMKPLVRNFSSNTKELIDEAVKETIERVFEKIKSLREKYYSIVHFELIHGKYNINQSVVLLHVDRTKYVADFLTIGDIKDELKTVHIDAFVGSMFIFEAKFIDEEE